jgi:hypothetical protein
VKDQGAGHLVALRHQAEAERRHWVVAPDESEEDDE